MCASRHASARGSGSPESTARTFVDSPPPRRVAASAPTLHGEVDDFSLGVHDARVAVVSCGKGEVGGRVNRGAESRRQCARCVRAPVKPAGEEWRAQRNVARARPLTFTHLEGLSHGPQRRLEGGVDSACRRAQRPKPRRRRGARGLPFPSEKMNILRAVLFSDKHQHTLHLISYHGWPSKDGAYPRIPSARAHRGTP